MQNMPDRHVLPTSCPDKERDTSTVSWALGCWLYIYHFIYPSQQACVILQIRKPKLGEVKEFSLFTQLMVVLGFKPVFSGSRTKSFPSRPQVPDLGGPGSSESSSLWISKWQTSGAPLLLNQAPVSRRGGGS